MNHKAESPKLELKLHLSPPGDYRQVLAHGSTESPCAIRPDVPMRYSDGLETGSMMLVGCPRCLMYVMMLEVNPKCPKCKSTVLLDFLREDRARNFKN